ncbi:Glycosyl hydrolase family 66 [Caprobacter fermentans]|uniref:Glycosyl hydrolase family 66 n=1 Tax=Caproicibacter fermentans TaxID=2576756 RepID=A0A6N8I3G0_9FIRM|nr:glycoside hydrolase family 66 protein [Caproicibacter fermentans]MVB12465.1 Glycosyl hydrolase family 66 [Caproicibacter fermentans]
MKKSSRMIWILLSGFLLFTLVFGCSQSNQVKIQPTDSYAAQSKLIHDVFTDKSAYRPKETVHFTLSLNNQTGSDFEGTLHLNFKHLDQTVKTQEIKVGLKKGEEKSVSAAWLPPSEDYTGYLVEVLAVSGNQIEDQKNTAVDVSSTWEKFPRYGYLCNYGEMTKEQTQDTVDWLCKYHINGLQFYDWQNSHDQPLAGTLQNPAEEWKDIANRDTFASTVKNYIQACHSRNMMACNYNLMFAAYNDYEKRGIQKEWGLYKDPEHDLQDTHELPASWASNLNLMNPGSPGWQNDLLSREKDAFEVYNFDVFHVDTLGNRGIRYDYDGNRISLDEQYTGFLNQAKKALKKRIVMNAVNGYGAGEAAKADTDFLYTEVWPDTYPTYSRLKDAVDDNTRLSGGKKSSVIAAYMNYKASGREFNENAVKLTDAVIFAAGGSHLELGDTGMLSSEYFPNQKMILSDHLKNDLRSYYDFLTAYENILHGQKSWSDLTAEIDGYPVSDSADTGSVWVFGSKNGACETIHLINLLSRSDEQWRDDTASCENPKALGAFTLKLDDFSGKVKSVFLASPDIKGGSMFPLDFSVKNGKLSVNIPSLQYWDMLVVQTQA